MRIPILIIILATSLAGCKSQSKTQQAPPAIPVVAAAPDLKDVPIYMECVGTLRPSVSMDIRPQVSGSISAVCVQEGQWVVKGDALFKINPSSYLIKMQEAEAKLAIDQAVLEAAKKKLERYHTLAKRDLIAQTEWDELEKEVAVGMSTLKANQARLKAARLDLEDCTIASPVDGRVGKLDIYPGTPVTANQANPLVTISKMDPLTVEFNITEKEYASLPYADDSILIGLLNAQEDIAQGTITFIDNHFDCKTGLLLVRAAIPNPTTSLRPGQYVRVRIPVSILSQAILIPQKAIKYSQEGPYIYVVNEDNTAEMRMVHMGNTFGEEVAIVEGLKPGEMVIHEGHLRIFPGTKVKY